MGIVVNATLGAALLWANVLNEAPEVVDLRMHHESLPVERGVKWGANIWIHTYDIRTLYDERCPKSFEFGVDPDKELPNYLKARAEAGFVAEAPLSMREADDAAESTLGPAAES